MQDSVFRLPRMLHRAARALALLLCLHLAGCATLWGGGDQERAPVTAGEKRDRSQQRVRIFITGVKGDMRTAVSGALELKGLMSRQDASDALVRRVHARAAKQMAKALQPFGYYHAKVDSTLELEGKTWIARFKVGFQRELASKLCNVRRIDLRYTNGFAVEWRQTPLGLRDSAGESRRS